MREKDCSTNFIFLFGNKVILSGMASAHHLNRVTTAPRQLL